jgi:tetratricopeptide (TPR) repeat protein
MEVMSKMKNLKKLVGRRAVAAVLAFFSWLSGSTSSEKPGADATFARWCCWTGRAFYEAGRFEAALQCIERGMKTDPLDARQLVLYKAYCMEGLGRDPETVECLDAYIELANLDDEPLADAYLARGEALFRMKQHHAAKESFLMAIELRPYFATAWSWKGITCDMLDQYDEAIECYDRSIMINPGIAMTWADKGYTLLGMDRLEEAVDCFKQATELDPDFVEAWEYEGQALEELGRSAEAGQCFDRVTRLETTGIDWQAPFLERGRQTTR